MLYRLQTWAQGQYLEHHRGLIGGDYRMLTEGINAQHKPGGRGPEWWFPSTMHTGHLPKEEAAEGHDVTWRTRATTKRRELSR